MGHRLWCPMYALLCIKRLISEFYVYYHASINTFAYLVIPRNRNTRNRGYLEIVIPEIVIPENGKLSKLEKPGIPGIPGIPGVSKSVMRMSRRDQSWTLTERLAIDESFPVV